MIISSGVPVNYHFVKDKAEKINIEKKEVKRYLEVVNLALNEGQQLRPNISARNDQDFMEAFLCLANEKKDGLNAHYCNSPGDMTHKIQELLKDNHNSARFVVNMGDDGIHFSAFEFFKKDEKLSVIGIEPATIQGYGSSLLAKRASYAVRRDFPSSSFAFIEADLQRSNGDCGMFSLFLVKKMLKEEDKMQALHEKNLAGELKENYGIVYKTTANAFLPPSFMKHAQSPKRLEYYLNDNLDARVQPVNKKGETLISRQNRHIVTVQDDDKKITYSNSIEVKRQIEIEKMFDSIERQLP